MDSTVVVSVVVAALVATAGVLLVRLVRSRVVLGTSENQTTYRVLHTTSLASPELRAGLAAGADRAAKHLRELLATPALALTDGDEVTAWDGAGSGAHAEHVGEHAAQALAAGSTEVLDPETVACEHLDCPVRHAVVAALSTEGKVVGALLAYTSARPSAGLVRAVEEVARFVSGQLELAEFDRERAKLAEAEIRALRAQISPHFIYNALGAIASYVRTEPEHARELLLDFADFTRYSFRRHGDFTTLADELRSVERYLTLEKARFGDRLSVTLRVAPEVLPVAVPFLCLQPLVENAVRHGLEGRSDPGHITIVAEDAGHDALISIDDDGVGMDPAVVEAILSGESSGDRVGIGNVDERLRAVYGDEYGLTVETAVGAGTKVAMRVPKYRAGVHVTGPAAT
ncbi:two-component system LytT family sensor kinase [Haloactinopolyspora alba]|uniref:Two-component system LytT family sensor kinase n=1 Tax=Haloactinopolyspora alba TaxID=648780 RepID=A0A2P8E7E7_9ACTN|nr:histidine kinase [Haloactinopolyspora alba]PSL05389.1 two-component system LytT family sensor kinase [Haloactinopolyspora alba]